jgi:hypothetical protein
VIYELGNPSDPYTFESDDFEALAAAVLVLGDGAYALTPDDRTAQGLPILLFGGAEEWVTKQWGSMSCFSKFLEVPANMRRMATALESIRYGHASDRRSFERLLARIPEAERGAAVAKDLEERHGSLNDIGGAALSWAMKLRVLARREELA